MTKTHDKTTSRGAERAFRWGIITWIGNGAGCLIGMIPIALPLGVLLTVVTLVTGIGAMIMGARAMREASVQGDDEARSRARWGFWLGLSHLVIVLLAGLALLIAWRSGALGEVGALF